MGAQLPVASRTTSGDIDGDPLRSMSFPGSVFSGSGVPLLLSVQLLDSAATASAGSQPDAVVLSVASDNFIA